MTDKIKSYLETASKDPEHLEKLKAAKTPEEVIALAKEKGHELSAEDFGDASALRPLSEDELDTVAGGGPCGCGICGVGGAGTVDWECYCVVGGVGRYQSESGEVDVRCFCEFLGVGDTFDP